MEKINIYFLYVYLPWILLVISLPFVLAEYIDIKTIIHYLPFYTIFSFVWSGFFLHKLWEEM